MIQYILARDRQNQRYLQPDHLQKFVVNYSASPFCRKGYIIHFFSFYLQLSIIVAKDELDAGAAVIRPPGHHAETNEAKGFCLFNNIAVAAKVLLQNKVYSLSLVI